MRHGGAAYVSEFDAARRLLCGGIKSSNVLYGESFGAEIASGELATIATGVKSFG